MGVTHRFGALHILPQQPVELQVSLSLVAGLQAFFDPSIDVSDGEDTERRVVWRAMELLLALGEDGKKHIVLAADVERAGEDATWLAKVGRLQEAVFDAILHAAHGEGDVGVELAVVFAEADYSRSVEEVAGGPAGRHAVLRGLRLDSQEVDEAAAGKAVDVVNVKVGDQRQRVRGDLDERGHKVSVQLVVEHRRGFRVAGQFSAGDGRKVVLLAVHRRADEQGAILALRRHNDPIHGPRLAHAGQVMLLLVGRLHQDKEVVQSEELADPLIEAAAGQQPILGVIDEEKLVDIVGRDEGLSTRLHNQGGVAGLVVVFWAGIVRNKEGQVARELVHTVDCSNIQRPCGLMDSQVVEDPVSTFRVETGERLPVAQGWGGQKPEC